MYSCQEFLYNMLIIISFYIFTGNIHFRASASAVKSIIVISAEPQCFKERAVFIHDTNEPALFISRYLGNSERPHMLADYIEFALIQPEISYGVF